MIVGEEGVLGIRLHEHVEVGGRGDLARVGVVQDSRERVGVGHRHRVRGDDAVARGDRHPPRHRRPPVVADDVEAVGADGVGEADDVADEQRQRVVLDAFRPRPGRVAALVGGHRAEPRLAEGAELVPPLVRRLGESVEKDHDLAVVRPRRPHVEREVADVDLRHRDPVVGLTRGRAGGGDRFATRRGPPGHVRRAPPRDGQSRDATTHRHQTNRFVLHCSLLHSSGRLRICRAGDEFGPRFAWQRPLGSPRRSATRPRRAPRLRRRLPGAHRRLIRDARSSTTTVHDGRSAIAAILPDSRA